MVARVVAAVVEKGALGLVVAAKKVIELPLKSMVCPLQSSSISVVMLIQGAIT